jgi:ATP-binding protein involved in chromosome partitioning
VIENMAWLDTPGGRLHPFGQGGARRFAEDAGLPFLGEVPLDPALREAGTPDNRSQAAPRPPSSMASAVC